MKINCNDFYLASTILATCAALLWNDKENFLKVLSRRLKHCIIVKAFGPFLFGMNMACNLSYRAIIVETQWTKVVKLVEDLSYHENQFVDLVSKIVKIKGKFISYFIVNVLY